MSEAGLSSCGRNFLPNRPGNEGGTSTTLMQSIFSYIKCSPRDRQEGRDSGNQTRKAMDLSVRAGFPVLLPASLPCVGEDGGGMMLVFGEEA